MRGGSHRASESISVSLRQFAWDRCLLAVLRHSSLPWSDGFAAEVSLRATALGDAGQLGRRDRLSLLAQFAAHQGMLKFCGVADGELDPAEWAIVQKRGTDCRLVRIAARTADPSAAPPALTIAQQFAELAGTPELNVFRQSWARAESVFIESFARLREDAAADLRWARRSAAGILLSPGVEALRDIASGQQRRFTYSDRSSIEALEALAGIDPSIRLVILRGRAIVRYGALDGLRSIGITNVEEMAEAAIVERVVAALPSQHVIFAVVEPESFDAASSRVVHMLSSAGDATWVMPESPASLPPSRWYFVAPRIGAARGLEQQLEAVSDPHEAIARFVAGPELETFLDRGIATFGDGRLQPVAEPMRSYIAALALFGESIARPTAEMFLREFFCERPLEDLAIQGVTAVDEHEYRFLSAAARRSATQLIPAASRAAICRVAAAVAEKSGDDLLAASLLVEAGEGKKAVELLGAREWRYDAEVIEMCDTVPRRALAGSARLSSRYSRALVRAARYRDARDVASMMEGDDRELVLAHVERRSGDYGPALARLERLPRSCEADLLRAEILMVDRRDAEAADLLRTTHAETDRDRAKVAYELALAAGGESQSEPAIPAGTYYAHRLATYRDLDAGNIEQALRHIDAALATSTSMIDQIDVLMDGVFALFSSGRWSEARRAALETLAAVEETQGDRAGGGLLFLLAYLAADDGQWAHASQRMSRLRHFYGGTKDARHLAELDLLAAHLDFSRGRFEEAHRAALPLLSRNNDEPIRVAAALIVDEADWIAGRSNPGSIDREPLNAEFADRWRMNLLRRGVDTGRPREAFNGALADWECGRGRLPDGKSGSEKLKLFRAGAAAAGRNGPQAVVDAARLIAAEMGIALETPRVASPDADGELRVLRAVARCEFPFAPQAFDRGWRYAARNRLGQWNEIGSLPPLDREQFDQIAETMPDGWIMCSDREILHIDGIGSWAQEARDAVAAAFRNRAELHRLQKVVEQEQLNVRARPSVAGIIGESAAIRGVIDRAMLVARRDVAVCILGESGTGKELIARAIHAGSPRRPKAFTAINCGALPENLIESELFGHARGAFTGADRDRAGLIEASDGGTLFLDEIGEMPLAAQAKLLRFLQEGEFRRVGDTSSRSADVRIVAATNRKLDDAVEHGRFREDLYYRIAGIEIVLPPLRERGNDVLALAAHFLASERERHRSGPSRFAPDVEAILMAYSWPGNVRELQNTVRGAHAMAGETKEVAIEHLPDRLRSTVVGRTPPGSYQDAVARFRRDLIERALDEAEGNQNRAATMLKISRQALGYQIRELGILVGKRIPRTAV